ncbi:7953_t:CDS:2 [Dentiscutata erythropus]|uniref:7953_t:CDS:1 n=1 Tax=Dentiscutata erythropus TaxID=1348616 RepID=A0A9N9B0J9_9GLOM|nr:7953_t:CDS:2 [Dentiscutata erythropus]
MQGTNKSLEKNSKALFRKGETEEIEMREALIKGLIPKKTQNRLMQLLIQRQDNNLQAAYAWTAQLTETGDIKLDEHTGRPQLLGPEQRKHLDKIVKKTELRQDLAYQVTVPRAVLFLKKEAMIRRVRWVCKYQRRRWNTTTDKATFQLFRNMIKVWYKSG